MLYIYKNVIYIYIYIYIYKKKILKKNYIKRLGTVLNKNKGSFRYVSINSRNLIDRPGFVLFSFSALSTNTSSSFSSSFPRRIWSFHCLAFEYLYTPFNNTGRLLSTYDLKKSNKEKKSSMLYVEKKLRKDIVVSNENAKSYFYAITKCEVQN